MSYPIARAPRVNPFGTPRPGYRATQDKDNFGHVQKPSPAGPVHVSLCTCFEVYDEGSAQTLGAPDGCRREKNRKNGFTRNRIKTTTAIKCLLRAAQAPSGAGGRIMSRPFLPYDSSALHLGTPNFVSSSIMYKVVAVYLEFSLYFLSSTFPS